MKKRSILLAVLVLIGSAKIFGSSAAVTDMDKHQMVYDTTMVVDIEDGMPHRILMKEEARTLTPRDWAEIKTLRMQNLLQLSHKQANRLYKLNLKKAKEMEKYAKKGGVKGKANAKACARHNEKFVKMLTPSQLNAYNQYSMMQHKESKKVTCCRVKGHGKRMVVSSATISE